MNTRELKLPSNDGIHKLHVVIWQPEEVRAVLQISHGMIEYIERYEEFAGYLTKRGFLVVGNDHLGHGHTAGNDEDLGYFCEAEQSATVVKDLHTVMEYVKREYPGVPYFLLGHSMGSFMARRFLMTYGKELTGAIIMGTGSQLAVILGAGKCIAGLEKLLHGGRYRSTLLAKLAFGSSNKRISPVRTENDWLSRDEKIVDKYNTDKYCTYQFTVNGFQTLFQVLTFIQKKENIAGIPANLPLFMVAGEEDPVGKYGKGVRRVYEQYKAAGIQDITLKLYPEDRHEILNELDRETVYEDIAQWLTAHI